MKALTIRRLRARLIPSRGHGGRVYGDMRWLDYRNRCHHCGMPWRDYGDRAGHPLEFKPARGFVIVLLIVCEFCWPITTFGERQRYLLRRLLGRWDHDAVSVDQVWPARDAILPLLRVDAVPAPGGREW